MTLEPRVIPRRPTSTGPYGLDVLLSCSPLVALLLFPVTRRKCPDDPRRVRRRRLSGSAITDDVSVRLVQAIHRATAQGWSCISLLSRLLVDLSYAASSVNMGETRPRASSSSSRQKPLPPLPPQRYAQSAPPSPTQSDNEEDGATSGTATPRGRLDDAMTTERESILGPF